MFVLDSPTILCFLRLGHQRCSQHGGREDPRCAGAHLKSFIHFANLLLQLVESFSLKLKLDDPVELSRGVLLYCELMGCNELRRHVEPIRRFVHGKFL